MDHKYLLHSDDQHYKHEVEYMCSTFLTVLFLKNIKKRQEFGSLQKEKKKHHQRSVVRDDIYVKLNKFRLWYARHLNVHHTDTRTLDLMQLSLFIYCNDCIYNYYSDYQMACGEY